MSKEVSLEIRVSVDVGYHTHNVAISSSSGEVVEEFEIAHRPEGFRHFFSRIEKHQQEKNCPVAVAMGGYNGWARPLDSLVRGRGWGRAAGRRPSRLSTSFSCGVPATSCSASLANGK